MKKLAAYIRISSNKGQTLDSQKAEIQKWLDGNANGREVVWFEDKATGNNTDRPGFAKLQKAVFNGEVDTVLVYKLDRLSRKLQDGINVICGWVDSGIRIVAVSQQIDFNGTVGKMFASVILAVAEMEQETRKERQAAGIAVAKKAGKYTGRKAGTHKADVARAKELREAGHPVAEIANLLGVSRPTVYAYLKI